MTDLILLLQADHDIQAAFNRYEEFQAGRGVTISASGLCRNLCRKLRR